MCENYHHYKSRLTRKQLFVAYTDVDDDGVNGGGAADDEDDEDDQSYDDNDDDAEFDEWMNTRNKCVIQYSKTKQKRVMNILRDE